MSSSIRRPSRSLRRRRRRARTRIALTIVSFIVFIFVAVLSLGTPAEPVVEIPTYSCKSGDRMFDSEFCSSCGSPLDCSPCCESLAGGNQFCMVQCLVAFETNPPTPATSLTEQIVQTSAP